MLFIHIVQKAVEKLDGLSAVVYYENGSFIKEKINKICKNG